MLRVASPPLTRERGCHAGQLLQRDCRVETDDTSAEAQRVRRRHSCASCLENFRNSELQVPASRCRVLTAEVGHISASRTFYVRWTILGVLDVEVKAFQLASSSQRLLIFRSVEDATAAARSVSQLVPTNGETASFRLCTNAKTFCPSLNFASGASCLVHLDRRAGAGRSGTAGQSQPAQIGTTLTVQSLSGAESGARPVAVGSTKRPREGSPPSEESATTTSAASNHLGALLGSEPLDTAIDSFLGALISDPPLTSGNLQELTANPVGSADLTPTCSSSSSDEARCSPGFDWLMQQEHQLGGGGSLVGGCCCATLPPSSSLTCCGSCSTAMHCAPITVHVGGGDVEQQTGGAQPSLSNGMRASSSRQHGTSVPTLNVEGQLFVAGETLKASGSSAWTVVLDARVKEVMSHRTARARRCATRAAPHPPRCTTPEVMSRCTALAEPPLSIAERDHLIATQVVATFDLGMGELLQLNPKIFQVQRSRRHRPQWEAPRGPPRAGRPRQACHLLPQAHARQAPLGRRGAHGDLHPRPLVRPLRLHQRDQKARGADRLLPDARAWVEVVLAWQAWATAAFQPRATTRGCRMGVCHCRTR